MLRLGRILRRHFRHFLVDDLLPHCFRLPTSRDNKCLRLSEKMNHVKAAQHLPPLALPEMRVKRVWYPALGQTPLLGGACPSACRCEMPEPRRQKHSSTHSCTSPDLLRTHQGNDRREVCPYCRVAPNYMRRKERNIMTCI